MYVIKNMRRTTPVNRKAKTNLPTIVPFYNVQLVKSVSKVSVNTTLALFCCVFYTMTLKSRLIQV